MFFPCCAYCWCKWHLQGLVSNRILGDLHQVTKQNSRIAMHCPPGHQSNSLWNALEGNLLHADVHFEIYFPITAQFVEWIIPEFRYQCNSSLDMLFAGIPFEMWAWQDRSCCAARTLTCFVVLCWAVWVVRSLISDPGNLNLDPTTRLYRKRGRGWFISHFHSRIDCQNAEKVVFFLTMDGRVC